MGPSWRLSSSAPTRETEIRRQPRHPLRKFFQAIRWCATLIERNPFPMQNLRQIAFRPSDSEYGQIVPADDAPEAREWSRTMMSYGVEGVPDLDVGEYCNEMFLDGERHFNVNPASPQLELSLAGRRSVHEQVRVPERTRGATHGPQGPDCAGSSAEIRLRRRRGPSATPRTMRINPCPDHGNPSHPDRLKSLVLNRCNGIIRLIIAISRSAESTAMSLGYASAISPWKNRYKSRIGSRSSRAWPIGFGRSGSTSTGSTAALSWRRP